MVDGCISSEEAEKKRRRKTDDTAIKCNLPKNMLTFMNLTATECWQRKRVKEQLSVGVVKGCG